ncbi:XRE family transcriptional regulator [Pseudonocardiaceae bacterium YIM PH 21723]|nr:XRE family transcriptional regulator [Pseudonocardiaceae bacterium YIM PH 21723]
MPSTDPAETAGQIIQTLRKAAGLTKAQLADRAHVSRSLIDKVELGDRPASHALLAAVARAFGVPIERLSGQPYIDNPRDGQVHRDVDALRAVLRCYDLPDGIALRGLDEIAVDVAELSRVRDNADYGKLAARLPSLLGELIAFAHTDNSKRQAATLLISAYRAAHSLAHSLGYRDLAEGIEHKMAYTAQLTEDPLAGGLTQWARAQSFLNAGDYNHGLQLMTTAVADLNDELRRPTPETFAVYGSLHLRAATLASCAGDVTNTEAHLAEARELVARLGGADQVSYGLSGLTFGMANTVTREVASHVELDNPAAAVAAAARWQPPRTMPRTRRGYHHISLARARLMNDDQPGALTELQVARKVAPQQTRLHPSVRETTAVLVSLHRRSNRDLVSYAGWLGL